MTIELKHLAEPLLEFGNHFRHSDSKTGLSQFGPFGLTQPGLHPAEIKVGFVGTKSTVEWANEWIEICGKDIESENVRDFQSSSQEENTLFDLKPFTKDGVLVRAEKILNPDFVGFNKSSSFQSEFKTNTRWERIISEKQLKQALEINKKEHRIQSLLNLFLDAISSISSADPSPELIIVALPDILLEKAHSVRLKGNYYLDFRRALKAEAMKHKIPTQLLTHSTVTGQGKGVQEVATRAWNFCVAQYYKANGVPWRVLSLEENTLFVGISFYNAMSQTGKLNMRSSVSHAFDYLGQGLVLRGDKFAWNENLGRTPHLTTEGASTLISNTLQEYIKLKGHPPKRVVIHKSSEFWDRPNNNEIEGFHRGIENVFSQCEVDLVSLRSSYIRLFREGKYPPLRGTLFSVNSGRNLLYTMGYIPFLETYPRAYVPRPLEITQHIGDASPEMLFREILALTKMNVNNCSFADGLPITLSFSHKVADVLKHVPDDGVAQPTYRFYI